MVDIFNIFLLAQTFQVTEQQLAVAVTQMHAIALTISEITAKGTLVLLHPTTVTIQHITVLPHLHEVILVYVTLIVVGTDAGAGSNGAVGHH